MEKVAIPQLGHKVAPRFEVARRMLIASIDNGKVTNSKIIDCGEADGYRRVRLLRIHRVSALLCNGINASFKDILVASGLLVIPQCRGEINQLFEDYIQGTLSSEDQIPAPAVVSADILHEDLIELARSLFETSNYRVMPGPGQESFLIDLIAEIDCPVCRLPVRVAICCGAHTYRADQEIAEFHHATRSGYHARVYFCPRQPSLWKCCEEYGIEAIDAYSESTPERQPQSARIPLLTGPIEGHERIRVESGERQRE